MGTLALDLSARRLSRLIEFTDATRAEGIHARLARWCESTQGHYAWVFDNVEDSLVDELFAATSSASMSRIFWTTAHPLAGHAVFVPCDPPTS